MPKYIISKVICCDCGKEYDLDEAAQEIYQIGDPKYRNVGYVIKCPYCGLSHDLLFLKKPKERR